MAEAGAFVAEPYYVYAVAFSRYELFYLLGEDVAVVGV